MTQKLEIHLSHTCKVESQVRMQPSLCNRARHNSHHQIGINKKLPTSMKIAFTFWQQARMSSPSCL